MAPKISEIQMVVDQVTLPSSQTRLELLEAMLEKIRKKEYIIKRDKMVVYVPQGNFDPMDAIFVRELVNKSTQTNKIVRIESNFLDCTFNWNLWSLKDRTCFTILSILGIFPGIIYSSFVAQKYVAIRFIVAREG